MLLVAPLVGFAHCLTAGAANAQCPLDEFRCDQFACYDYVTTHHADAQMTAARIYYGKNSSGGFLSGNEGKAPVIARPARTPIKVQMRDRLTGQPATERSKKTAD
jgi:hypothetical protein